MLLNSSPACSYTLTAEEQLIGTTLNTLQLAVMQNYLSEAVAARLALQFNASSQQGVLEFVQQEAYQKGKIELLQYIIAASKPTQLTSEE